MDDFEDWVRAAYPRAYRTACLVLGNPADAEEAVQEAFLRAWRFRDAMPAGDRRAAWLYRILINTCRSRWRAESARPRIARQLDDELPGADLDGGAERVARSTDLQAALALLPEDLRVAVVLHYYVGLLDREIGIAVHRRAGTVRARLSQARRRLAADPLLASWAPALTHRTLGENAAVERQS